MQNQLQSFHDGKNVFREFRGARTRPQQAATGIVGAVSSDEALGESSEDSLEVSENGHFNFIKMHLMTHFTDSIKKFGQLNAWSTEVREASHVEQLKEGWAQSNHRDTYAQIIKHRYRKHQFKIQFLNLEQLIKEGEKINGFEEVYPDSLPARERREQYRKNRLGIDAGPVKARAEPYSTPSIEVANSTQLQPKVVLKSPENRSKWVTIDQIKREYAVPDLNWALYAYLRTLPASQTFLRPDFHPSSLADFRAQVYKTLAVPIEDFQHRNVFTNHVIRTNLNWQKKGPRKDFIIFQKSRTSQYGDLKGKAVAKLELLLIVHNAISNKTFQLAFVTELKPYAGGTIQSPHGFVRLTEHPLVDYEKENHQSYRNIIPIRAILGLAHLISYGTGSYLLNTHIDLNTWNEIYSYNDENIDSDIDIDNGSDIEEEEYYFEV
ncbi:uncharacterized protein DFL_002072 [Arthrobotrys flagrans]|uniref:Uncharacterized protein n=1 Tax=Arthrobotrys flagrans TaxID=97331 RepID=A0A437A9V0_ARTFL|nr:hypothetical protein DFL_002072 [Arthrobotrys flagrans]